MHQTQVERRQAFVADEHAPEVLEPRMGALNGPAVAIPAQRPPVLMRGDGIVRPRRDDRLDPLRDQAGADGVAVIAAIRDQALRPLAGPAWARALHRDGVERRLEERRLRGGSRRHGNSERSTLAIGQYHELRSLAALGEPDQGPPFFATMNVPSMKHSSQRTCWRSLSWARNARQRFSSVSSAVHWVSRRWTVLFEPYRAGSALQGAPVQSTHKMPSKHRRASTRGRPPFRLRLAGGRWTRIRSHCASVTTPCHAMHLTPFFGTTHGVIIPPQYGFWDEF